MRGIHPTAAEIHICPGPVQCQFFGPSESLTTSATLQLGIFAFLYQPTSARPRKLLPIPYQAPVRPRSIMWPFSASNAVVVAQKRGERAQALADVPQSASLEQAIYLKATGA